jgi:4-hydroxy-tetrahydrodipicolinate synthase
VPHVAPQGDRPVDGSGLVRAELVVVGDARASGSGVGRGAVVWASDRTARRIRGTGARGAAVGSAGMESRHQPFTGVGVALLTLFDRDGGLDAAATARHAAHLVERGVRGVLVAGSTGEAATLDADERSELLAAVRDALGGSAPVIAGTGAPSARQAVALSRRAAAEGADALLVLSPPGTDDPRPYYDAVTTAVDVPVLAYHYPTASAPGIPVDLLGEMPVAGVKDSSGDPVRLAVELDAVGAGVYTGSAALVLQAGAMGCTGAILALANVDPDGCRRAWEGDGPCQRELVNGHRATTMAGIAGLKRALAGLYGTSTVTRVG